MQVEETTKVAGAVIIVPETVTIIVMTIVIIVVQNIVKVIVRDYAKIHAMVCVREDVWEPVTVSVEIIVTSSVMLDALAGVNMCQFDKLQY